MLKKLIKVIMSSTLLMACGCSAENIDEPSFEAITKLADLKDIINMEKVIVSEEHPYNATNSQKVDELPEFLIESLQGMGWDLRDLDLSDIDMRDNKNLIYATFNEKTIWPEELPEYFDPTEVLEEGKNPGLGIRELHEQGITGKGVNIAIIDQTLDINHQEYKDQLMLYEKIHSYSDTVSMHGPAVSSLAVGKTVGVAPEAKLYFIACDSYESDENGVGKTNLNYLAEAIERLIEINEVLPAGNKISVISISKGIKLGGITEMGSNEVYKAIEKAKENGIFVITTTTELNYDFSIFGLGRKLGGDPDDLQAYTKGLFWQSYTNIIDSINNKNTILVPMDRRTYAYQSGNTSYAHSAGGGFSWSVPWLAGMYALCVQVDPDIDPDTFIKTVIETGDVLKLDDDKEIKTVINPQRLIDAIQARK